MTWNKDDFYKFVNDHKSEYIQHLRQWVEIPSVSCQSNTRGEVFRMLDVAKKEFEDLGAKMWMVDNPKGEQFFPDGESVQYRKVQQKNLKNLTIFNTF